MNAARRSDGTLNADGIVALALEICRKPASRDHLLSFALASRLGNATRTSNSLTILRELGLLFEEGTNLRLKGDFSSPDQAHKTVRLAVRDRYCQMLQSAALGSVFQLGDSPRSLRVDSLQLPYRELGYPMLLRQFGIASRAQTDDRAWTIAEDSAPVFLAALGRINRQQGARRKLSLKQFQDLQNSKADAGKRAEEFVLAFERRRLAHHPFVDLIRAISEEDVGAGFDILSFDKGRSALHDRLIEVKGFGTERSFYWSNGEMAAALEFREKYWIYLIDRNRMSDAGYVPEMITDPYAYFVEQNPAGWIMEPQSHKFSRPDAAG